MKNTNRFIIDWLSFTSKIHTPLQIMELLGLDGKPWQSIKGACGYRDRFHFGNISIHYNGSEDMGVWCELSGRGCRVFEEFGNGNYSEIFKLLTLEFEMTHITRLDIAYDDFSGVFDIHEIAKDTLEGNYISKWQKWEVINSSEGITITHGSRKSDSMLRIYDKAAEQQVDGHWVRVELQLRDDRALGFVKAYQTKFYTLGELYINVLSNYIRYVVPSDTDTNKWRWNMKSYWSTFVDGAVKISIFEKPGTNYTIYDLESFVINQAGNAIKTYIDICGEERFLYELGERCFRKNPKYELLKVMATVNYS